MRVAAHLGISFKTYDAKEEYKKRVADRMLDGYKKGLVPNPDVLCNEEIKFGVFYEWARREGADAVATGHYAQSVEGTLVRGIDPAKDQSYFLYTLKKDHLPHILFPIGEYRKEEVRKLAREFKLPVSEKPDSQGLCFIGEINMAEFLAHELGTKKGDVLNEKGEVIGKHNGAHLYTLGARHGFTVHEATTTRAAHYVVAKDVESNTLTVGTRESLASHAPHELTLTDSSWVNGAPEGKIEAQYRYHGPLVPCEVKGDRVHFLEMPIEPIAPGQSVVFYDSDTCLGGGFVS
jgi:tRNA-specific 2-thiouridylase